MAYDRDTEVELKGTFADAAGNPADPDAVTLYVQSPNGATVSYTLAAGEVTRVSQGVFTRNQVLHAEGDWHYRFKGVGTLNVAGWKLLTVAADPFA